MKILQPKLTAERWIAIRGTACGAFTCALLAFVSARLNEMQLLAELHHHSPAFQERWIQCAVLVFGGIVACILNMSELLELNRQGGRAQLLWGIIRTLGFFTLGFFAVGMLLPSQA